MGRLEELIPNKIRKKLGPNFKLTKDTAKKLYFELDCELCIVSDDLIDFFKQFSDDELISWNNEYYKYMDNKLNSFYNQDVSLDNLIEYSFAIYIISQVYTDNKENYVMYLSNIKKYITKYGYIMFYSIEGTEFDNLKQYALPWLYKIFMFDVNGRFFKMENRCLITLHKMYPTLDKYGLVPIFIHLGYDDLLKECLDLLRESLDVNNVLNSRIQDLLKKLRIKIINYDLIDVLKSGKEYYKVEINSYLKEQNKKIMI